MRTPFSKIARLIRIADHRVRLGRVAADQQEHVGVLDLVQRVRGGAASEDGGQSRHRGAVAHAGAVVDVVRAQHRAHELLEEIILFVRAPARRDPHDGLRTVLSLDRREPVRHQPEGFFPRRLAKAGEPRAARRVLDKRRGEPVGMVHEVESQAAFHAQIGLVERLASRRFDADDPAVVDQGIDLAARSAVRAQRRTAALGLAELVPPALG